MFSIEYDEIARHLKTYAKILWIRATHTNYAKFFRPTLPTFSTPRFEPRYPRTHAPTLPTQLTLFCKLFFKQGSEIQRINYRRISTLLIVSKILEKLICRQFSDNFKNVILKFQQRFGEDLGGQHYLLLMIDECKKVIVNWSTP